jgi:formiminotetrahydrofolate cyclodeaminase
LHAADRDAAAFASLMAAQRLASTTGDRIAYQTALVEAATSPIDLAALAIEIAVIADRRIPNAARFAASDLTASIAMCYGAAIAALATAHINVDLLTEEQDAELLTKASELRARSQALGKQAHGLALVVRPVLSDATGGRA